MSTMRRPLPGHAAVLIAALAAGCSGGGAKKSGMKAQGFPAPAGPQPEGPTSGTVAVDPDGSTPAAGPQLPANGSGSGSEPVALPGNVALAGVVALAVSEGDFGAGAGLRLADGAPARRLTAFAADGENTVVTLPNREGTGPATPQPEVLALIAAGAHGTVVRFAHNAHYFGDANPVELGFIGDGGKITPIPPDAAVVPPSTVGDHDFSVEAAYYGAAADKLFMLINGCAWSWDFAAKSFAPVYPAECKPMDKSVVQGVGPAYRHERVIDLLPTEDGSVYLFRRVFLGMKADEPGREVYEEHPSPSPLRLSPLGVVSELAAPYTEAAAASTLASFGPSAIFKDLLYTGTPGAATLAARWLPVPLDATSYQCVGRCGEGGYAYPTRAPAVDGKWLLFNRGGSMPVHAVDLAGGAFAGNVFSPSDYAAGAAIQGSEAVKLQVVDWEAGLYYDGASVVKAHYDGAKLRVDAATPLRYDYDDASRNLRVRRLFGPANGFTGTWYGFAAFTHDNNPYWYWVAVDPATGAVDVAHARRIGDYMRYSAAAAAFTPYKLGADVYMMGSDNFVPFYLRTFAYDAGTDRMVTGDPSGAATVTVNVSEAAGDYSVPSQLSAVGFVAGAAGAPKLFFALQKTAGGAYLPAVFDPVTHDVTTAAAGVDALPALDGEPATCVFKRPIVGMGRRGAGAAVQPVVYVQSCLNPYDLASNPKIYAVTYAAGGFAAQAGPAFFLTDLRPADGTGAHIPYGGADDQGRALVLVREGGEVKVLAADALSVEATLRAGADVVTQGIVDLGAPFPTHRRPGTTYSQQGRVNFLAEWGPTTVFESGDSGAEVDGENLAQQAAGDYTLKQAVSTAFLVPLAGGAATPLPDLTGKTVTSLTRTPDGVLVFTKDAAGVPRSYLFDPAGALVGAKAAAGDATVLQAVAVPAE